MIPDIGISEPTREDFSKGNNVALFDPACGWCACTSVGMCWQLFEDKAKQMDRSLAKEAQDVVKKVLETGEPPFGGWS